MSDPSQSPGAPHPATPPQSPEARPPRSRAGSWFAAVALMAAVGGGVFYWQQYSGAAASAAATPAAAPPPEVTVSLPVYKELVEWDEYTGQFAAVDDVEVRARVSGYIESIHFEDGQTVARGDLLFVIDPRPFQIDLDSAKAQLDEAVARLDVANRQLERTTRLRKDNIVAATELDQRIGEAAAAKASVAALEAAVRAAELNLEYTRVTAPIAGRVGRHEVSVGNLVTGGSGGNTTMLTTIVSLDPIYFEFDISEANLLAYQRAIADGRLQSTREHPVPVAVRLTDERQWSREGTIDFIDNQVDRGAGTIRARAVFANADGFITPGQFGRLRLPGSELYKAILLPDSAIVTDQAQKLVMTVAEDGTVVPKVVRTGPMELGLRIIREGLAPTDRVIVNGLMRVRPGMQVTPQPGEIELPPQG